MPNDKFNISKVMQVLKKNISQDINKIIGACPEGDNSNCRLQKIDCILYRKLFIENYRQGQFRLPKFKWQKSYHDHIIRNQKDLDYHIHHTSYNYLKHELPEDWKYNSLNFPELIDLDY